MIKDKIREQMQSSLKKQEKERLGVLRYILSQIQYKEINSQKPVTEEETVLLLRQEIKKRNEAIEMFKKGAREDLVDANLKEIKIIEEFLPASISDDEINKIIDDVLKRNEGETNIGKIIGQAIASSKGKADNGKIAQLVKLKFNKG